jgi:hypothetical protein
MVVPNGGKGVIGAYLLNHDLKLRSFVYQIII